MLQAKSDRSHNTEWVVLVGLFSPWSKVSKHPCFELGCHIDARIWQRSLGAFFGQVEAHLRIDVEE